MKQELRLLLKKQKGIRKSDDPKKICKKCLYHNREKICQIHGMMTKVDEVCDHFTSQRKHKVYRGGNVSPK